MALETVNRFFAGVKVDGGGNIRARSGLIAGVVRNGIGDYTVTLQEPIAAAENVVDCACVEDGGPGNVNVRQLTDTTFQVFTFAAQTAGDADFALSIFQLPAVS